MDAQHTHNVSAKRVPLKDSSKRFVNVKKESRETREKALIPAKKPVVESHMVGEQLAEWQRTWRVQMKTMVVYFDENSKTHRQDYERAVAAFRKLGATMTNFFGDSVGVIVSLRPYNKHGEYPVGDMFRIAHKRKIKVWNYDKISRFMHHLGETVPDEPPASKLSSLLRNEKLFGPNDRDPSAKRDDVKYFSGVYIYAYDLKQETHPVAVREWRGTADCPQLCGSTNGKSVFVGDGHAHNVDKRHSKRRQYFDETKEFREKMIEASCAEEPGTYQTCEEREKYRRQWEETERDLHGSYPYARKEYNEALEEAYDEYEKSETAVGEGSPSEQKHKLPELLPFHRDNLLSGTKFKNEYGEIQASGVLNQSGSTAISGNNVGNGLGPSHSLVHNKKIAKDKLKTMVFDRVPSHTPVAAETIVEEKENERAVPPKVTLKPAQLAKVPHDSLQTVERKLKRKRERRAEEKHKRAKREAKPGYCENCRVRYNDFEDHIRTDKHRQFAENSNNFAEIDDLIRAVNVTRMLEL